MKSRLRTMMAGLLGMSVLAPVVFADGKYVHRQRQRGEVTDTAPKLDRWAFINDAAPEPSRMVLVVDTWTARRPQDPRLLPLVVSLSYEGDGKPIPIGPDRFELTWEGASAPVQALDEAGLKARASGPTPLLQDLRALAFRQPVSFDTPRATRVSASFYSHPSLGLRHDRQKLSARGWIQTLMYFPVPEGFTAWDSLFELRYVPVEGEAPGVTCLFRIQRDPGLQQEAMRRARKDLRKEERRRSRD